MLFNIKNAVVPFQEACCLVANGLIHDQGFGLRRNLNLGQAGHRASIRVLYLRIACDSLIPSCLQPFISALPLALSGGVAEGVAIGLGRSPIAYWTAKSWQKRLNRVDVDSSDDQDMRMRSKGLHETVAGLETRILLGRRNQSFIYTIRIFP